MSSIKFSINASLQEILSISDPAAVNKSVFNLSLDYIESVIGNDVFNALLNGFQLSYPEIPLSVDNKKTDEYLLINYTNFNNFVIVIKSLMGDKYNKLKEDFLFEIYPLDFKLNL